MSRKFLTPALVLLLCTGVFKLPAHAAKGNKADKPGRIVKEYDSNNDGKIEGAEANQMRKAFEAEPSGPLKQFDTDKDGKLSDSEIADIKMPEPKNPAKKAEKKAAKQKAKAAGKTK